jgi:hypothetical protein
MVRNIYIRPYLPEEIDYNIDLLFQQVSTLLFVLHASRILRSLHTSVKLDSFRICAY